MREPDFEALRTKRNAEVRQRMQKLADEMGVDVESMKSTFNPHSCYCACASGGPCEHKWDGETYESGDGAVGSATCSRCGMTAMSHDLRNAP